MSFIIKFLLKLHNFLYSVISSLSLRNNGGVHPKHKIMNYHTFFLDNIKKGSNILDIGCGYGALAASLSKKAGKVFGIDIIEKNIIKAKTINPKNNVSYIYGDATIYNFSEKFDCVVLSNVLEHIDKRVEFLKKIKKLSNKFLIRVPMLDRDWLTLYKKELGVDYRLDPTHFTEFTMDSFKKEIELSGLKIESYYVRFGEIYSVIGK